MDRLDKIQNGSAASSRILSSSSSRLLSSSEGNTNAQGSPTDAKRLRIAQMIRESSERIKRSQKEESQTEKLRRNNKVDVRNNNRAVEKDKDKAVVKNKKNMSESSLDLKDTRKAKELINGAQTPNKDKGKEAVSNKNNVTTASLNLKKDEERSKGFPSTWEVTDDEKVKENGLIGLPFYGSWKNAEFTETSEMKRNEELNNTSLNGRFTHKDNLRQSNYSVATNNTYKRQNEDRDNSVDNKRRKIDGNQSFVPSNQNQDRNEKNASQNETSSIRSRGRGKDINKPAWMTRQDSHSSVTTKTNEIQRSQMREDSSNKNVKPTGRGRGRGKDMNKPAWMTQRESGSASISKPNAVVTTNNFERNMQGREHASSRRMVSLDGTGMDSSINTSATGNEDNRSFSNGSIGSKLSNVPISIEKVPDGGLKNIGRGRGRGRGKDINKPAWMTRQQSDVSSDNGSNRNATNESVRSHEGTPGISRGKGRGRDLNKPTWMTKKQSDMNSDYGSSKSVVNSTANNQEQTLGVSRGRGRGRDLNKPAWMTAKESSKVASQGSRSPSTINLHNTGDNIVRDSNSGSRRGIGRGSDINKPAWLTMKESRIKSNSERQNESISKNVSAVGSMGIGRGRGRGKDINKPAWMTKQESNNPRDQDSASRYVTNSERSTNLSSNSSRLSWRPSDRHNSSTHRHNRTY